MAGTGVISMVFTAIFRPANTAFWTRFHSSAAFLGCVNRWSSKWVNWSMNVILPAQSDMVNSMTLR